MAYAVFWGLRSGVLWGIVNTTKNAMSSTLTHWYIKGIPQFKLLHGDIFVPNTGFFKDLLLLGAK